MKIIIITNHNVELIQEVVEKDGHAVVAQSDDFAHLFTLLIQHTPHVCFFEAPAETELLLEKAIALFPQTKFVQLGYQRGTTWTQIICDALAQGPVQLPWRPAEPERRMIVMDLRYFALSSLDKLKRPVFNDGWEIEAGTERLRLLWMMHTARQVAERAEAYRHAVSLIDGAEWQEIVYRTVHGSFKSMAWARDQLARYTGYLCHFVPGADVDSVMPAVPQPADLRFLHYESSLELRYAVFCLALFGFNPDLGQPLLEATKWRYEGGPTQDLTRTALATTGLLSTFKTVVLAHATAVGWLIDPDTVKRLAWKMPRPLRRALQTFRDFWGLTYVLDLDDFESLAPLIEEFHSTSTQEPLPESLRIPTFAEFHQATQEPQTNANNQS